MDLTLLAHKCSRFEHFPSPPWFLFYERKEKTRAKCVLAVGRPQPVLAPLRQQSANIKADRLWAGESAKKRSVLKWHLMTNGRVCSVADSMHAVDLSDWMVFWNNRRINYLSIRFRLYDNDLWMRSILGLSSVESSGWCGSFLLNSGVRYWFGRKTAAAAPNNRPLMHRQNTLEFNLSFCNMYFLRFLLNSSILFPFYFCRLKSCAGTNVFFFNLFLLFARSDPP